MSDHYCCWETQTVNMHALLLFLFICFSAHASVWLMTQTVATVYLLKSGWCRIWGMQHGSVVPLCNASNDVIFFFLVVSYPSTAQSFVMSRVCHARYAVIGKQIILHADTAF